MMVNDTSVYFRINGIFQELKNVAVIKHSNTLTPFIA